MKPLVIGNKIAKLPIIQGGMGVGVSLSRLAGAVAAAGGIGIISSAQAGFEEEDFKTNHCQANIRAIKKHIKKAKEMAKGGLVGVNVMTALKDYKDHVKAAVEAGADVVICGAGLPTTLPELVAGSDTKFAPIVSSAKAASVLLRKWDKKYNTTADFVLIEGPKAGGHLGFSNEDLDTYKSGSLDFDEEIKKIIDTVKEFDEKYQRHIPVIVAGGIFDKSDIERVEKLGADGVQIASRFVVTEECDASDAYKQAYIKATEDDVKIIKSPVGMPGRAINNKFLESLGGERDPFKCFGCLARCNPAEIPYCITDRLIKAVRGDVENGLIFAGANVGRITKMTTVPELIAELGL